jgi:hypothetical protein
MGAYLYKLPSTSSLHNDGGGVVIFPQDGPAARCQSTRWGLKKQLDLTAVGLYSLSAKAVLQHATPTIAK